MSALFAAAEKARVVIPSEARNLSSFEHQKDSSAKGHASE
jgi:hypothetical protein